MCKVIYGILLYCVLQDTAYAAITWDPNTPMTATVDASDNTACDNVMTPLATSPMGSVSYTVTSETPSGGGFSIGPYQGDDTLLCTFNDISTNTVTSYSVVIGMTAGSDTGSETITVTVTNLPILAFTSPADGATININEDHGVGALVVALAASKGTVTSGFIFSITNAAPLFEIDGSTLKTDSGNTVSSLDVDASGTQTSYTLTLRVSDGSDNVDITYTVQVDDINDNAPQFTGSSVIEIDKNAKAGVVVATVTATDADRTSPNNDISYSLGDTTNFTIGSTNGELTLVVDSENIPVDTYTLTITATDGGSGGALTTDKDITFSYKAGDSGGNVASSTISYLLVIQLGYWILINFFGP